MEVKQVIVVRKDLKMRKGKIAAQAAHASMKVILGLMEQKTSLFSNKINWQLQVPIGTPLSRWLNRGFAKVVVSVDSEEELFEILNKAKQNNVLHALITDAGKTEFGAVATNTCAAIGPDEVSKIDEITGHLKLM